MRHAKENAPYATQDQKKRKNNGYSNEDLIAEIRIHENKVQNDLVVF